MLDIITAIAIIFFIIKLMPFEAKIICGAFPYIVHTNVRTPERVRKLFPYMYLKQNKLKIRRKIT